MKAGAKGHEIRIKEPDIRHAFKINQRTEKFDIELSKINAHTLRIIEIIEAEKNKIEGDNHRDFIQNMRG